MVSLSGEMLGLPRLNAPKNRIYVNQDNYLATLGSGAPLSTVEYFIESTIDPSEATIVVGSGGLFITGYNFELAGIQTSAASYTLFSGNSGGNILFTDFFIDISGVGSQVYDVTANTGQEAVEVSRINYNNCTSMGTISGYRQGLEAGTGRFGGKPELTLEGTWLGGYFIETSIVRGLVDGDYSLFKAGGSLLMKSRFRSNMNLDLPSSASYIDFIEANFPNPSTLQLSNGLVTRNGIQNSADANLTPNITKGALACIWQDNVGLRNTTLGGRAEITSEAATVLTSIDQFEPVAGTFTASELEHFDSPESGQLRHLGKDPIVYRVDVDMPIDGTSRHDITLRVSKSVDNGVSFNVPVLERTRQVSSLVGPRDVAFFNFHGTVEMKQNDRIRVEVANNSGTANVTAELDGVVTVEPRS